ncbi:Nucleolin [Dactylellina cionopaga]|nr:Nucleolin [Dactylellina cionopaga]
MYSSSFGNAIDQNEIAEHKDTQGNPLAPTKRIYVGNISYGIRGEDLEREFSEFGKVVSARVIYDPRGLSKGFGYVEFDEQDSATTAVTKMHGLIVDGRRINVQYVLRPDRPDNGMEVNPPSRTLFIGNLSFDITDKDLNELFADVRNCTDVRVAIDRRTGQPRGFAHADFVDIASAESAKDSLQHKSIYGRQLRIDFTKTSPQRGGNAPSGAPSRSFINPNDAK